MTVKTVTSREKKIQATTNVGRPSDYDSAFAIQAEKLCQLGATMEQLADFFGVDVRTIYRWKNKYVEFCQSIKAATAGADDTVERSLYQRAHGYETTQTEREYELVEVRREGQQPQIVRKLVKEKVKTKHIAPDPTSMIFWLKNRRPEQWRENYQGHSNEEITPEQLAKEIMLSLKAAGQIRNVTPKGGDPSKLLLEAEPVKKTK